MQSNFNGHNKKQSNDFVLLVIHLKHIGITSSKCIIEFHDRIAILVGNHKAILHQAKVLFEKEGIGNVTIEQISESADVSRSTFFSHFASVDDLLKEISDEEINDVFEAARKGDGELTVSALLKLLNDDTYPYPYLSAEVLMRGILSKGESNFAQVDRFLRKEIVTDKSYANTLEEFSSKELSALILGAFFGLIFQKMINNESFTNPDETSVTIQKFIKYLKNQEELS